MFIYILLLCGITGYPENSCMQHCTNADVMKTLYQFEQFRTVLGNAKAGRQYP
jgi:hypothetical protein